ncbi:MAG: hypothetical protein O7B81_05420, partial [Gammaproteobacteria bacterium]|nr:hypothetical protein [Gammaproteobacteria bacterium]
MVSLEKVTESLFQDVYESLLKEDDPGTDIDTWRLMFMPRNDQSEDYAGYALVDGSKVVGVIGMIFSERQIDGQTAQLCNLHSWMVNEEYRGHSLTLLRPAIRLSSHTLTDFTPTDPVRKISRKLGFEDFDVTLRILPPIAGLTLSSRREYFNLSDDPESIRTSIGDADARLLRDHQLESLGHLLVTHGGAYCYVIYNTVIRHVLAYAHILYISNTEMFAKAHAEIRKHLLGRSRGYYVAVDARLVAKNHIPFSFNCPVS